MTMDSSGNLYVVEQNPTSVVKILPGLSGRTLTISTGVSFPQAVAVDSSGNIYVANGGNTTVTKYGPGGGTPIATYPGLTGPSDVAIDASGNLYVSYFAGGSVYEFAPGSTTPSDILTLPGSPITMAFDASGNLYVGNYSYIWISKLIFSVKSRCWIGHHTSSLPSRLMNLGGTNNAAVAGINLTSTELATYFHGCQRFDQLWG